MLPTDQPNPEDTCRNAVTAAAKPSNSVGELVSECAKCDAPCVFVIVERNAFFRDCLMRSLASHWPGEITGCASLSELTQVRSRGGPTVALLSVISLTEEEADAEFALLEPEPLVRTMVLAKTDDLNEALAALSQGANGYISMSAGFEIFVQAMRFVSAGGTYVPAQCLMAAKQAPAATPEQDSASGITSRELTVIQAIRQGKPNKVIAYELNMCESTVKVHVRHIMRKLHARNRTDVAIKGAELARADGSAPPLVFRRAATRINAARQ
jgi:DNA-binding NarL/FixJ family response regulator